MLVGVGGSGKQSLTRLAAYMASVEVFQITLSKGYSIQDLKVKTQEVRVAQSHLRKMCFLNLGEKNQCDLSCFMNIDIMDIDACFTVTLEIVRYYLKPQRNISMSD